MRCGGDGLKHRSCQRKQYNGAVWYGSTIPSHDYDTVYHGSVWYGSTIPSHDHDVIWAVLSGDTNGGDGLKLDLKPARARRT